MRIERAVNAQIGVVANLQVQVGGFYFDRAAQQGELIDQRLEHVLEAHPGLAIGKAHLVRAARRCDDEVDRPVLQVQPAVAEEAPGRAAGPGVLFTPPVVEVVRDEASKRIYAMIPTAMNDLVGFLTENCCGHGAACGTACNPAARLSVPTAMPNCLPSVRARSSC